MRGEDEGAASVWPPSLRFLRTGGVWWPRASGWECRMICSMVSISMLASGTYGLKPNCQRSAKQEGANGGEPAPWTNMIICPCSSMIDAAVPVKRFFGRGKVFLSLGGEGTATLCSEDSAK